MKWFLAGLGIGVGLGVVMAPARGEESRRKLREGATRTWDEMSEEARAALEQMRSSDWARQARDVASQARERVTDMKRDAQQQFDQAASNIRNRAKQATPDQGSQQRNEQTSADQGSSRQGSSTPPNAGTNAFDITGGNNAAIQQTASDASEVEQGDGSAPRESLLELLNEGSQDELIAVSGIGPGLALKIVQHRPYKTEQQPLEDNVIPPSAFEALRGYMKRSA